MPQNAAATPWAAALHVSARPLIALATQLRSGVPANPAATGRAVRDEVAEFERALAAQGFDARSVAAASYVLCVWLDEVIAPHGWATTAWQGRSLLAQFHQEDDGRQRVFQLLDRLMQRPAEDRALLELFHVCLSLGLQGQWQDAADGPRRLEALRRRLAQVLGLDGAGAPAPSASGETQGRPAPAPALPLSLPLSLHWQPAAVVRRAGRGGALMVGAVLLAALVALGVYVAAQWSLAQRVDGVFAQLQQLEGQGRQAVSPQTANPPAAPTAAAASAASGRLATALAAELREGRLAVRDEAHRSVVSIDAAALFAPGTTRLTDDATATLARVADALGDLRGRVLVTAYAAPDAARAPHIASASQLADAWAGQVRQRLQQQRDAASIDAEGRASASAPGGRIEIVWFP